MHYRDKIRTVFLAVWVCAIGFWCYQAWEMQKQIWKQQGFNEARRIYQR